MCGDKTISHVHSWPIVPKIAHEGLILQIYDVFDSDSPTKKKGVCIISFSLFPKETGADMQFF